MTKQTFVNALLSLLSLSLQCSSGIAQVSIIRNGVVLNAGPLHLKARFYADGILRVTKWTSGGTPYKVSLSVIRDSVPDLGITVGQSGDAVLLKSPRMSARISKTNGNVEFLAANGYNNFNVVIIGAGKVGLTLAEEIKRHPGFGLRIVGFLDDNKSTKELGGTYEVLGKLADLEDVIRRRFVSKIFVTIHPSGEVFQKILEAAKEFSLAVKVVPQAFDKASGDLFRYNIGFIPILEYSDIGERRRQYGKRLFDLLVSFVALVPLIPVFVVTSIFLIDSMEFLFSSGRRTVISKLRFSS